ncbi:M16 family metallopeptidase [Geothrix fuzhouensis]|uniref:M16 family metallopeptidase n=1 Tax=Geothrix fuzhouensis TaxID=2966451 RepID=UPI0021496CF6|nr:insulinase family protein [Geothrix fuzhouensis]
MRRLALLLLAALGLNAQALHLDEVQERRLANGVRLLVVERRGLNAFHAALVFRGGRAEEPPALAGATDLLARTLYGATWPEDLEASKGAGSLDALLKEEEGLLESLRLERLRQRKDPAAASQASALGASLWTLHEAVRARFSSSPLMDVYAARGGRQTAVASADALLVQTELPMAAFEFWCHTEAQRLAILQLSRFSEARAALAAELRGQGSQGLALLQGAALPGHPYGRDLADHLPALEAMRRSELQTWARRACGPDRLTVVLIGGLAMEAVLPLVERSFGALPTVQEAEDPLLPEIPADLGDRHIQASLGGAPGLLVGWRIPPRPDREHLALRLAACLLGGGPSGRLTQRLVHQKALAQSVEVRMDLPGGRLPGLLVISLVPTEGHSLAELEGALHTEILRLQQEPIPAEEWQRALTQIDVDQLRVQDEPAALARALCLAWVEAGDWRQAEQELQRLRNVGPEAVQAAARTWLNPSHRTTLWLQAGTDAGQDPLEAETARVLKALAATRIEDLAQREHMVAEGLRQLRMLSMEERRRTLKLLEAQLSPEKR